MPTAGAAQFAHPDADTRIAARAREEGALDALEAQITRLWGHINAATAQFLALVVRFDRKEGWAQHGMASCAQWLSWQCGIGPVAAREKVRALTRVATAATEETLLHIALNGTAAHVERTVRGFRRVQRERERGEAEAMHERRYLDCRRESDGSVRLQARLAPEVGELLLKALEAAQAQLDERGGDAENAGAAEPARRASRDVSAETPGTQSARRRRCGAVPESVSAETPPRSASQRRAARGLAINAHTARCGRGGERMDYNIAIEALCREAGHT